MYIYIIYIRHFYKLLTPTAALFKTFFKKNAHFF